MTSWLEEKGRGKNKWMGEFGKGRWEGNEVKNHLYASDAPPPVAKITEFEVLPIFQVYTISPFFSFSLSRSAVSFFRFVSRVAFWFLYFPFLRHNSIFNPNIDRTPAPRAHLLESTLTFRKHSTLFLRIQLLPGRARLVRAGFVPVTTLPITGSFLLLIEIFGPFRQ